MTRNKGFDSKQSKKSGWQDEKVKDEIFESIPVDQIDYDKLNKEAKSTEELLKLEAQKILKHNQQENMGVVMDNQYYFNVFFICKKDKDEFLEKLGVSELNDVYINGYDLAEKLGIKIEKRQLHLPKPKYLK